MHESLNIPFSEPTTTRPRNWRVVWLFCLFLLIFSLAWVAFRLWTFRDTTSFYRPEGTTMIWRVVKTPTNMMLIDEHLGAQPIWSHSPWTFRDILDASRREFSLVLAENGDVSIVLDQAAPAQMLETATNTAQQISTNANYAILGSAPVVADNAVPATKFSWKMIFPTYNSEYLTKIGDKFTRSNLIIDQQGFRFRQTNDKPDFSATVLLPEAADLLAIFNLNAHEPIPDLVQNSPILAQNQSLFDAINQNGAQIVLATDEFGLLYDIAIPTGAMETEPLTQIGEDMISRQTLTTLSWILPDSSTVDEIRASSGNIDSNIQIDENLTTITFTSSQGDVLRINKTSDLIRLTNRAQPTKISDIVIESTCLAHASTTIKQTAVRQFFRSTLSTEAVISLSQQFPWYFSEIASNSRVTRLCW